MNVEVYNAVAGPFFSRLIASWEADGVRVASFEAVSERAYRARRGLIGGLALRWNMYAGHALGCWRAARRSSAPAPIRIVTTNPFFAPALVAKAARGRGATINLLYDLYPEALVHAGVIAPDSWMARRCEAVTRYALRECSATVYLGERTRAFTEGRYGPSRRSEVIPVGADGAPFRHYAPLPLSEAQRPRILYSGQMGAMHDTATVSIALSGAYQPPVEWVFHATGRGYAGLRSEHSGRTGITWGEALPNEAWQVAMRRAQVALVTIARGAERVVMPSKTYSALVAGQAILAVCPRASDLADLVHRHNCGWVIEPGDAGGFMSALDEIASGGAGLLARRQNAFEAGHRLYDLAPIARHWQTLFRELARAGTSVEREAGASAGP
jgi:glycosyltransferase involved in cell wall biosynthesis